MKQIINSSGQIVKDMVRNSDGSISLNMSSEYKKNKLVHDNFNKLSSEILELREQMKLILEKLNG